MDLLIDNKNKSFMDAKRGWTFVQPQEKGLFTFYREQQERSDQASSDRRDNPSFGKQQKLPVITPTRQKPQLPRPILSPSASLPLHEKLQHRATPTPSPTSQHRMRKLLLPLSQSAHKQLQTSSSPRSIIQLTFEHQTPSPRKVIRHHYQKGKGRARTEGGISPTSFSPPPLPHSTPLKQSANKNNDPKQDYLFDYFTDKYEPPFKMKALAARQSLSKRIMKTLQDQPRHDVSSERDQSSCLQPIVKPVPILPMSGGRDSSGMSISFWDYFQQRKKLLLGRYKRERACKIPTAAPRRPKPALTNNHI